MNMSKYKFNSFILISILLLALFACSRDKNTAIESGETEVLPEDIVELRADQAELAGIKIGYVENRTISGTLKANGIVTVAPQNYASVCIPMGGFVISTNLVPGNSVTKGQTLAVVENQDFIDIQQSFIEAKSKFEFAEAEYKRHNELFKNDVYSQQNVQEVTANYLSLKAQVKAYEQKLSLIGINPDNFHVEDITRAVNVISPISGYLKSVHMNIGKYVTPSDILFEIVNTDKLLLELSLFEKDANLVKPGQKIRFYINDETEQHDAVIDQTGKSIGADKTFKVFASVLGHCANVIPGMYVKAVIQTSEIKTTVIPSDAIVNFDDKDYIFVFEKEKEEDGKPFTEYRMIEVQKGVAEDGFTEVLFPAGFDVINSKVVVKGAYNLLSAKKNAGEMAC